MKYHMVTVGLILGALFAYLAGLSLQSGILVGVGIFAELVYWIREMVNAVKTIEKR